MMNAIVSSWPMLMKLNIFDCVPARHQGAIVYVKAFSWINNVDMWTKLKHSKKFRMLFLAHCNKSVINQDL